MRDDAEVVNLVARAGGGDSRAWDELVERYAGLVLAVCRRHNLTATMIDDVAQTVWLRLVEHLSELQQPAALAGWLRTTTARECLRVLRAAKRQSDLGDQVDPEGFDIAADEESTGVDRRLLEVERHTALRAAFRDLDARCQRLLSLLVQDPRPSYAEIGRQLGMEIGSIGPNRSRCLDKLRRHPALVAQMEADREGGEEHARSPVERR